MKRDPDDPKVALGVDVLAPEGYGEIIGGGQREDDLDRCSSSASTQHKLPERGVRVVPRPAPLRHASRTPASAWASSACVAWICGLHHVRETIPFARMMERITP